MLQEQQAATTAMLMNLMQTRSEEMSQQSHALYHATSCGPSMRPQYHPPPPAPSAVASQITFIFCRFIFIIIVFYTLSSNQFFFERQFQLVWSSNTPSYAECVSNKLLLSLPQDVIR